MPRTHRLTATVATLSLGLLGALAASAQNAPRATVAEPIHDAGIVAKGETVRHSFRVTNEGSAPLEIHEVRPACGCTVASYDETVPPGGVGEITALVSTDDFRGPIAKYVTVLTNDLENPRFRLTIRADIRPIIDILPGYARFLHVRGGDPKTQTQNVWATDGSPLEITSTSSSLPYIAVESHLATEAERTSEGPDQQWVVIGTLASDAPAGPLNGTITVTTNHPDYPELSIPLGGYVRPQLLATPVLIDFGTFPAEQPRKASVIVTNYSPTPVAISSIESDIPGLVTELEEQTEGRKFAIHLTLNSQATSGPFKGQITIRTDNPQHPTTTVPVQGAIQ